MIQANENSLLKAALDYHRLGWAIIPVPYKSKKAKIRWKQYQTVLPAEKQIIEWFGNGQTNIAVILGEVSGGLACRDFDTMAEYDLWAVKHPELAKILPTVQTARGKHIYFISNFGKIKKIKNGELRGNGYCLLPPSLHPSGIYYKWLIQPNGKLPELSLTDFTEEAEEREEPQHTPFIASISSASSASSVSSVKERVNFYENLDEKAQCYVNTAIKYTMPDKKGYRNILIFQFCRWLKGHSEFEKCSAGQLKPLVRLWHEKALPTIKTKSFDETWADFCYGWTRVKYPKGNGTLKIAVQNAMKVQKNLDAEKIYEKPEVKLLVRICFELQALQKTEPIWLSENDGALIFNVTKPTVGKWLSMLEADGIIKKVAEHTATLATRYKFIAN